ncbi:phosphatidylethanolamine-binding protein [Schizophyllum amplum]|uniref:Phosphatidylethanolamine-binding protein n=1 Tax=Schizophyllum amplum TaxID=97359 RepID=A0A550CRT4_9AGAR|nr:phosphatidylethanolamine-binding protein [Auriculariopsis ampla]
MAALASHNVPSLDKVVDGLKEHGVFPDILPYSTAQQLKGVLEISYPSGASITAGQKPHRDEVQQEPKVRFHPPSALDASASYTLIMTDPDLMKHNDPLDKQVRHWVQPGLKLATAESPVLAAVRPPHTTFLASAPMPMTGAHRYVFILARETRDVGTGERNGQADFKERLKFDATEFVREQGLEVVGVALMKVAPTAAAGAADAALMAESAKHMVTG